jgi:hypothetical protein
MNRPARFRPSEVTRAVRAVEKAGLAVGAVDIAPDGAIRIIARDGAAPVDPYDAWKAKREARGGGR